MYCNTIVPKGSSYCANCPFWMGERDFDPYLKQAKISSFSAKGKCYNRSGYFNLEMAWNASCSHFEKHPIINQ